jgi:hypothetical protein
VWLANGLGPTRSRSLEAAFKATGDVEKHFRIIRQKTERADMKSIQHSFASFGSNARLAHILLSIVAFAVAAIAVFITMRYASQPLLEHEAWRQTQTALTSYWMMREGCSLAYQTPVLGYPWEIPLEFPIYQAIVAFIAALGNFPLDPVGRWVSFAFLAACLWPAWQISRRLALPPMAVWIFAILLLSSPIYLFYGRNFLIETTALFFTLASIPYAIDLRDARPKATSALWFAVFTALGMLQKITTTLPVTVVLFTILVVAHLWQEGVFFPARRRLLLLAAAFGAPLLITALWFQYANAFRTLNPLMTEVNHTNAGMIRSWFSGNDLRLNPGVLGSIFWERMFNHNGAGIFGLATLLLGFLVGDKNMRIVIAAALVMFAVPVLMFIQHHHFLDYYQVSVAAYMLGAIAVALTAVLRIYGKNALLSTAVCAAFAISNYFHFSKVYGAYLTRHIDERNNATLAVSRYIKEHTPSDTGIVVFGLWAKGALVPVNSWSSEMAYYSERKALTVRDSAIHLVQHDPASFLGDRKLGAMVFCGENGTGIYAELIQAQLQRTPSKQIAIMDCTLLLPIAGGTKANPSSGLDLVQ